MSSQQIPQRAETSDSLRHSTFSAAKTFPATRTQGTSQLGAHQRGSQVLVDEIMSLISKHALRLHNRQGKMWPSITISVKWDLDEYCVKELEGYRCLPTSLVVIGSEENAYVTTCAEYVERYWPQIGPKFLKGLVEAMQDETTLTELSSHGKFDNASTEELIPSPKELLASQVAVRHVKEYRLCIEPLPMQSVSSNEASCWHDMFVGSVLALNFPIPARRNERGVEVPFDVMAALALVHYPMDYLDGIVLKGYSTILVPLNGFHGDPKDGSVQWHFVYSGDQSRRIEMDELKKEIQGTLLEGVGLEQLSQRRALVGYWQNATVRLGTKDSGS
ncbi:hypothetical protein K490DRAFT_61878 [Saccharata proteae CBS 121410]|uniref:Uncharacterized protein n=1 Tax=Saccharata proteae CBS 121410 TaxID=1314787 RepID=A0A9P4HZ45_9PEZI|nr:hypothetical protein K490DRAFT_61878 [Saccharata proteae CBS 121410]